jgi:hypothetical protein
MNTMNILFAPMLEFKLDATQPGRFKGYGSTFGNVDLGKDRCVKGCFARSLAEHAKNGTKPAMNWMHDKTEPVGDWIDANEDSKGLMLEGQLWTGDQETECSRKAANMLRGTGPKGLSMGYKTQKFGYDQKTGVRSLEDVDLMEVSVVGYGMNPKAVVTHIKSLFSDGLAPTVRDIEELLRDAGFSAAQAKAFIATGWKGVEREAVPQKTMGEEIQELLRLRAIMRGESVDC